MLMWLYLIVLFCHKAALKNKWDWGFMAKKKYGRAKIFLFYFIFYFSDCMYVRMYIYIYIYI